MEQWCSIDYRYCEIGHGDSSIICSDDGVCRSVMLFEKQRRQFSTLRIHDQKRWKSRKNRPCVWSITIKRWRQSVVFTNTPDHNVRAIGEVRGLIHFITDRIAPDLSRCTILRFWYFWFGFNAPLICSNLQTFAFDFFLFLFIIGNQFQTDDV